MKKLLYLIILFFLLSAGKCKEELPVGTSYVYEHTYNSQQQDLSITDAYKWTDQFGIDSIALDQWMNTQYTNDKGYVLQRVIMTYTDTAEYSFIYTTFASTDSTWYQFKIRKKLKQ